MGYMPVESLRALSDSFAQQQNANSNSYNAIMRAREDERRYLMDNLLLQRRLGHEGNKEQNRLNNGFGFLGALKNIIGYGNLNADTGPIMGGHADISNEQPASISMADKLAERVKRANTSQEEILADKGGKLGVADKSLEQGKISDKGLSDNQKAFMIADAAQREATGEGISGQQLKNFNSSYADKKGNKTLYGQTLDAPIADSMAVLNEQAEVDATNAKIDKDNAVKMEKVKAKQEEAKTNALIKGHRKYQGDFSDQTAQAQEEFYSAIQAASAKGDYDKAELLQSKYNNVMKSIYKRFNDDWKGEKLFERPKGGKGPKYIEYNITDANGNVIDSVQLKEGEYHYTNMDKVQKGLAARGKWGEGFKLVPAGKNDMATAIKGQADADAKNLETGQAISETVEDQIKDAIGWKGRIFKNDQEEIDLYNKKNTGKIAYIDNAGNKKLRDGVPIYEKDANNRVYIAGYK